MTLAKIRDAKMVGSQWLVLLLIGPKVLWTGPNVLEMHCKSCFHYRDPCNENRVPCNENRFFSFEKNFTGKTLFSLQGWVCSVVQNVKFSSEKFGPVQTNLDVTKPIWTFPNHFYLLLQSFCTHQQNSISAILYHE
jgi:hypothetical protein